MLVASPFFDSGALHCTCTNTILRSSLFWQYFSLKVFFEESCLSVQTLVILTSFCSLPLGRGAMQERLDRFLIEEHFFLQNHGVSGPQQELHILYIIIFHTIICKIQWTRYFLKFNTLLSLLVSEMHCKETIPRIQNKYSQKWSCPASFPIPTFMFRWAIYIVSRSAAYSAAGK